ncbi:LPS export ABC transporter ATP-binding protein [Pseudobdellovibrio sp. HCB154]|uniref:LPS export ABC transporter ATP-binding protein n=1 Tax=Pseudobdellovibrio sp. HCB154 TaxID=3386277 RepID=UPI00391739E7
MAENATSTLTIKNISKKYGERLVVKDVSFEVQSGQVVGLLGPNGAGKTTSFYMVVGLVKSDSGSILLNALEISEYPMYKRARAGLSYLAQEPSIFRRMTVEDNILVALEAHGYNPQERREKLESLLQDFRVNHIRESFGYALSGGERRRVEIARALAGSPHFLLLDEPFAGIDPIAVGEIQNIIRDLKAKGIGVLITDHNVRETLGICDYAYILKDGIIQVSGNSEQIANSETARKFYLGENFKL